MKWHKIDADTIGYGEWRVQRHMTPVGPVYWVINGDECTAFHGGDDEMRARRAKDYAEWRMGGAAV